MFHATGLRFTSIREVRKKISAIESRWNDVVAPAIVQYATESGREEPKSNEINGNCNIILIINFY